MLLTRVPAALLGETAGANARAVKARGLLSGARCWACTSERICAQTKARDQSPLQCSASVHGHRRVHVGAARLRGSGRECSRAADKQPFEHRAQSDSGASCGITLFPAALLRQDHLDRRVLYGATRGWVACGGPL